MVMCFISYELIAVQFRSVSFQVPSIKKLDASDGVPIVSFNHI